MNSDEPKPLPCPAGDRSPEKSLDERTAKVRHDLKNPLTHILGFAEMLLEDAHSTGAIDFEPGLLSICEAGDEMMRRIQECLDPPTLQADPGAVRALQEHLRRLSTHVLQIAESLLAGSHGPPSDLSADDLPRIAGAARQVLQLTDTTLVEFARSLS